MALHLMGLPGFNDPNFPKGAIIDVPVERAVVLIRRGFAEPVGWTVPPRRKFLVRALGAGSLDNHVAVAGEIVVLDEEQLTIPAVEAKVVHLSDTPVRVRAVVACSVGGRSVTQGEIIEIAADDAAELITWGRAELVTGDASPSVKSKSAK